MRTKGAQFRSHARIARTCLQDAVEITFDDLFQGYASGITRGSERIARDVFALHTVNLGGSIVERRSDVPDAYATSVIPALRAVTGDAHLHDESCSIVVSSRMFRHRSTA